MQFNQADSAEDENPFRPPQIMESVKSTESGEAQKLRLTLIIFALSILVGVVMAFVSIVSISASGAVISSVGLILILLSKRNKLWRLVLLGGSGLAITLVVFGIIFVNGWSPDDASTPVALIALAYAAITLPLIIIAFQRVERVNLPRQNLVDKQLRESTS